MNKPICKVPWVSLTLGANGDIKPCCVFKGGQYSIHKGDTVDDVWKKLDGLRQQFLNHEQPQSCNSCWAREATLGTSRRLWYDDKIENWPDDYSLDPPMHLRHMDLNFGNTCNLKCRMCGSWCSTAWFKDDVKLNEINTEFQRGETKPKPTIVSAEMWKDKKEMFQYLERIDFKGGEPMMQDGMFTFLEYLIEWGFAQNITIAYTTNGTKTPERLKELWPKFKKVKLVVSVEGTGELYEYIRGEDVQNIDQLRENIAWFDQFDNLSGSFNSAIQIYNIFDLNNLLEWFRDTVDLSNKWHRDPDTFKFDCLVTNPAYLDINIMPDELKKKAVDKIEQKNYRSLAPLKQGLKKSSFDKKQWELFIHYTRALDKMRGNDVVDVVPELKEYFSEDNRSRT